MTNRGQCVTALAAVTAVVAGCGGSDRIGTVAPAASPSNTRTSSWRGFAAPVPVGGPTTCTVYARYATQIIFGSQSRDVRAMCQAWIRNNSDEGYLWGYEPTSAKAPGTTRACSLTDEQRSATASVIEDTGFRPVSAVQRAVGSSACATLRVFGWRRGVQPVRHGEQRPPPDHRPPRPPRLSGADGR